MWLEVTLSAISTHLRGLSLDARHDFLMTNGVTKDQIDIETVGNIQEKAWCTGMHGFVAIKTIHV